MLQLPVAAALLALCTLGQPLDEDNLSCHTSCPRFPGITKVQTIDRTTVKSGRVIFEDKFVDASGGWNFGADKGLLLAPPGAKAVLDPKRPAANPLDLSSKPDGSSIDLAGSNLGLAASSKVFINRSPQATEASSWWWWGAIEASFPAGEAGDDVAFGLVFWVNGNDDFYLARLHAGGKVDVATYIKKRWSIVWETKTTNLVKTGPTAINSLEAKAIPGTIKIIVNGQALQSFTANALGFNYYGFYVDDNHPSTSPLSFTIHAYWVKTLGTRDF